MPAPVVMKGTFSSAAIPGHLGGLGVHEHDVDAEGLVREGAALVDVLPEGPGIHAAAADEAHGPRVGDGRGELAGGDVGHAALDDGEFRAQELIEFHFFFSSFYLYRQRLTTPAGRRPR